ncbi:YfgM family protein [Methylibium rhizosphaerae]|uniref:YfgM family protein n=1 Tax=Methylibium rhizosphaerae TaxID=2570323 RepID=UPI00112AA166|nr:tetratricopeptide repeat protein [Methylibium rhizosphaerae]
MATHLDLEEQEQLDQLKHFWRQWGNFIVWTLVIVLGAFAAYNGWNMYQRSQAAKASVLFDELDRAAQAGDVEKAARVFSDMKEHYGRTAFAEQAGLLAAKLQADKGKADDARAALEWVAANAVEDEYRVVAKLRLAGMLLDQKKYDDALGQLPADAGKAFEGLVADRRGDILQAQGKKDEAKAAYQQAWKAMDPAAEYRRLVEAKLTALGAAPVEAAVGAAK